MPGPHVLGRVLKDDVGGGNTGYVRAAQRHLDLARGFETANKCAYVLINLAPLYFMSWILLMTIH
jgi:hypothetical protein